MDKDGGSAGARTDWRAQLGAKLVTAEEAVNHIHSGDRVVISIAQSTPLTLCTALAARLMELENVVVNHGAAIFSWDLPGLGERFRIESFYLTLIDRPLYLRGAVEYTPVAYYRANVLPPSLDNFNVSLILVSPPDANGYVNFGDVQIMAKLLSRNAKLVIAEVSDKVVRIGGDNSLHISEIDYFVEQQLALPELPLPVPSEEEKRVVTTICETLARELVPDRATVQVGVGSTSGMLMPYLRNHHDLGLQTEIIPWGTADLVRAGVLTGKYKKIFPEVVVGSAFALATPRADLEYADGHPAFQLYDFNLTDDLRLIAREDGIIAINNGLSVDLTGQADSESIAHQMYTGTGGQTAFGIAACMAGGKSIIALPATAIVKGARVSRIVATLAPGAVVTLTRSFVHYVVTEYGIATLLGKSIKDRARELIAIAHPDFRAELAAEAKRLYG
jgi:4-hydroxybutyrate CoA-transferase